MSQQFLRTCTLSLSGGSGDSLVVRGGGPTDLRVQFAVESRTTQAPDQCQIVITNPAPATVAKVQNEFTDIVLSAGYEDNSGQIFYGSIVETQYGEKVNDYTDTLLRIFAAAYDKPYNQGRISQSLAAGCSPQDIVDACVGVMAPYGITGSHVVGVDLSQPKFPRGVVLAGMARDYIREVALTARATWTLRDGKVNIIGANARDTGSTVVLSAKTGLIGQPILRQEGLIARCRINPAIQLSTNVQIDAQIVRPKFNLGNDQTGSLNPATTADYDIYNGAGSVFRVLHMQTNGDTRGEDWSTELTLGVGNVLNAAQGAMHLDPNLGIGAN